jgi:hypothetical protein
MEPAADAGAWDAVIREWPDSCAFHASEWKRAVTASLPQYRASDFVLKSDGETVGAWSGFTFAPGPWLAFEEASPWHLFGGLLTPGGSEAEDAFGRALALWEAAARVRGRCALAVTLPPRQCGRFAHVCAALGFAQVAAKRTHLLHPPPEPAALWERVYKGSVRTDVRKARRQGVRVRATAAVEDVRAFYRIYSQAMAGFGSLAKPYSLVRDLAASPLGTLLVAERRGRVVAGLLHLHFGSTVTIWMQASIPDERRHAPNHLLYHTALTWAVEHGYRRVDFGASPPENHGLMAFKESFGAAPADFGTFRKVLAPLRDGLWRRAEPLTRWAFGRIASLRRAGLFAVCVAARLVA